jgi:hypothetical protein
VGIGADGHRVRGLATDVRWLERAEAAARDELAACETGADAARAGTLAALRERQVVDRVLGRAREAAARDALRRAQRELDDAAAAHRQASPRRAP